MTRVQLLRLEKSGLLLSALAIILPSFVTVGIMTEFMFSVRFRLYCTVEPFVGTIHTSAGASAFACLFTASFTAAVTTALTIASARISATAVTTVFTRVVTRSAATSRAVCHAVIMTIS